MRGRLNDGRTSAAHEVDLVLDVDDGIVRFVSVAEGAAAPEPWPLSRIRLVERTKQGVRLSLDGVDGARLQLGADARDFLLPYCTQLRRRPKAHWSGGRVALWSAFGLFGLIATLFVLLPKVAHQAAVILPDSLDRRLGESSERGMLSMLQFDGKPVRRCVMPAGLAALDRLTQRLATAGGLAKQPQVIVLDSRIVNAFALPGNRIMLLSGILERAESGSVIAGVLGHEMGHLAHHDPTEALVRNAGMGLLIGIAMGDVFGGSSAGIATLMLTRSAYSREAESGADGFAIATLAAAGIESAPLGRFYSRIGRETKKAGSVVPSLLASHPDPGDRQAQVERDGKPGIAAMNDADWAALLRICDKLEVDKP